MHVVNQLSHNHHLQSPEFELALYTLIFLAGRENNQVTIDEVDINIKCYRFENPRGNKLGSAYPELA